MGGRFKTCGRKRGRTYGVQLMRVSSVRATGRPGELFVVGVGCLQLVEWRDGDFVAIVDEPLGRSAPLLELDSATVVRGNLPGSARVMETPSLFTSIARHRPEWVAQGVLAHALRTEPGLQLFVCRKLRLAGAVLLEVEEERHTASGWRADLRVRWARARRTHATHFELKLAAGPTTAQVHAGRRNKIEAVVVPRRSRAAFADGAVVFTWHELAAEVRDGAVAGLLRAAAQEHGWVQASLDAATLAHEMACYAQGGRDGTWPNLYRFLCTVHGHLEDLGRHKYIASSRWSVARKARPAYYGFDFHVWGRRESRRFWLGFVADSPHPVVTLNIFDSSRDAWVRPPSVAMSAPVVSADVAASFWKIASKRAGRYSVRKPR